MLQVVEAFIGYRLHQTEDIEADEEHVEV